MASSSHRVGELGGTSWLVMYVMQFCASRSSLTNKARKFDQIPGSTGVSGRESSRSGYLDSSLGALVLLCLAAVTTRMDSLMQTVPMIV